MDYSLAKELKDAGFPFEWTPDEFFYEKSPFPTLSELIEACGDDFKILKRYEIIEYANATEDYMEVQFECNNITILCGSTPEEAVARLWLALHKK